MNTINKFLKFLNENNYQINQLEICFNNNSSLDFVIKIENNEKFLSIVSYIKNNSYLTYDLYSNIILFGFDYTQVDNFNFDLLLKNVEHIKIMIVKKNIQNNKNYENYDFLTNNLSENLKILTIISSLPLSLKNLPNCLEELDLSLSECEFDLSYLPESLKVLRFPNKYNSSNPNNEKKYTLHDKNLLHNLPSGLKSIYFEGIEFKQFDKLEEIFDIINKWS
jgi:hypothetical protein